MVGLVTMGVSKPFFIGVPKLHLKPCIDFAPMHPSIPTGFKGDTQKHINELPVLCDLCASPSMPKNP
ncbi:hypothetical protein H4R35_002936 [Dimargaris xerosporica]|nr:hypothetical protein H4R35_002936 [Dimargaris xerosporica]